MVIAALLLRDDGTTRPSPALAGAVAPPPEAAVGAAPSPARDPSDTTAGDSACHIAVLTANVYSAPTRAAEVVAIVPAGRTAELLGRSADGGWLRVAYPPGSLDHGWLRASALGLHAAAVAAAPVVAAGTAASEEQRDAVPAEDALPDLTIADAFLLQDGSLAIAIRNIGDAGIVELTVSLHVAKVEGDILGVLRIGPTTLEPGGSATVVTPVLVADAGSYRLELDVGDEIAERQEQNNTHTALLIPGS